MKEIPVYLFTGFLESGKTKFIQETLEDKRFNKGERTLLLVCEEGEEEYVPERFSGENVFIQYIEDTGRFTPDRLSAMVKRNKADRVVVEYNGMWQLSEFYNALPDDWTVYQEMMFADSTTFVNYNANMRSLVVDKLQGCELVIFNRCTDATDKMPLHKIVRGISRRADIAYDYVDGHVEYDDIEDPLPFDIEAPVIVIGDRDFALWYRDLSEEMDSYEGKTVHVKGLVARDGKLGKNAVVIGRHIMTCCADDIAYSGLVCNFSAPVSLKTRDWITVTAKIALEPHKLYGGRRGPVRYATEYAISSAPTQEVATFY